MRIPGSTENPITPEELAQRISLDSVTIFDEGGGDLSYKPGDDLLTDHYIEVLIDANKLLSFSLDADRTRQLKAVISVGCGRLTNRVAVADSSQLLGDTECA